MQRSWKNNSNVLAILIWLSAQGCFSDRNFSALSKEFRPSAMTAVMPFRISAYEDHIHGEERLPGKEVVKVLNEVLDTLAQSDKDNIIGPSELRSKLDNEYSLDNLINCTDCIDSSFCKKILLLKFLKD